MINSVTLVGRVTKDLELKKTTGGISYLKFTLAVNRKFSGQNGEKKADFISVIAWRGLAENTVKFVKKGHMIGVGGSIVTDSYQNAQGNRVYTTEVMADDIQFLEKKKQDDGQRSDSDAPQQNYTRVDEDPFSSGSGPIDVSDDDLPF